MKRKAFVLLSGGLDSTTALHKAMRDYYPQKDLGVSFDYWVVARRDDSSYTDCNWVEAVSIDYGQRHKRELLHAAATCETFGIKHTILDVGNLLGGKEVLLSAESIGSMDMVHKSYDEIQGVSPSYVPFRNGLLLSAITAHAQKYVNSQIRKHNETFKAAWNHEDPNATALAKDLVSIYYGAHAEDAHNWAYPDCTAEFNGSMANAIYTGSYNTIRLVTPLQWLTKDKIVELGEELRVDWAFTWSCYDAGEYHCGKCPTCLARKSAFARAGILDPTKYVNI